MATIGLVSLAANFANLRDSANAAVPRGLSALANTLRPPGQPQLNAKASSGGNGLAAAGNVQDQFTPSAATTSLDSTAVAAGLFAVNQLSTWTVTIGSLLGSNLVAQPDTALTNDADNAAEAQTATLAAPPPAARAANTTTAVATSAQPALSAVIIEDQLQALNNSLAALGVNADGLRQIDQIASLLNDYSPTAFTSLAYELVALSRLVGPPATTNAPSVAGVATEAGKTAVTGAARAATA